MKGDANAIREAEERHARAVEHREAMLISVVQVPSLHHHCTVTAPSLHHHRTISWIQTAQINADLGGGVGGVEEGGEEEEEEYDEEEEVSLDSSDEEYMARETEVPSLHHCRTVTAPSLYHRCTIAAPSLPHHRTITAPCEVEEGEEEEEDDDDEDDEEGDDPLSDLKSQLKVLVPPHLTSTYDFLMTL